MYEFHVALELPFETARAKVVDAIAAEKLGVVSEINVQAIAKNKLGKDVAAYTILGACAPDLALQVLGAEPNGGALLPCNVVVREAGSGKTVVSFLDPGAVLGLAGNDALDGVMQEAMGRLQRVRDRLV